MYLPKELIINEKVIDDPVTQRILGICRDIPVKYVNSGRASAIVSASAILNFDGTMLDKILAGKHVLYVGPATTAVDMFVMPDERMLCPDFDRLKLASNGCFYMCDWCYLKLTYRANFPFISVKVQYDRIKEQIARRLEKSTDPVIFNSGELADALALEHLTGAGRAFIPWFGKSGNGYLYMLTKSDGVEDILDLDHNGHTIIAWSMNNEIVSRKYERGAPPFHRRLEAAKKVQDAGYPLRIRLDPVVPFDGWQEGYADTIRQIFERLSPERVTLGTLRFEKGFYHMRNTIFTTDVNQYLEHMVPMFEPKVFPGSRTPKAGKYSFPEEKRTEIFRHCIDEIRKYSDCKIALCKESASLWEKTGLNPSRFSCACQLDFADMEILPWPEKDH